MNIDDQAVVKTLVLLDTRAVADRVGLTYPAVRSRRQRGELPTPDFELSVGPIWLQETIDEWATRAGLMILLGGPGPS